MHYYYVLELFKFSEQYGTRDDTVERMLLTNSHTEEAIFENSGTELLGSQIIYKFGLRLKPVSVQIKYESYESTFQLRISYGHMMVDYNDESKTETLNIGEPLTLDYI